MGVQLIICMETPKKAGTDWAYIKDALEHFFVIDNDVKLSPVFMTSKSLYNSNGVLKQIEDKTKKYTHGKTYVIYCVDTDDIFKDTEPQKMNRSIEKFCNDNGNLFVWFCRDIEEVFWKKQIPPVQKTAEARRFRNAKQIDKVPSSDLSSSQMIKGRSNILAALKRISELKANEYKR